MSLLLDSLEGHIRDISNRLQAPWSWTTERLITILARYPVVTQAVIHAEVDVLWQSHLRDRSRDITLRQALHPTKPILESPIRRALVASFDRQAAALCLRDGTAAADVSASLYLLPHQYALALLLAAISLPAVSLFPTRLLPGTTTSAAIYLPTQALVFHVPKFPPGLPHPVMWVTIQKVDLADARRATLWGVTRRTVAAAAATEPLRQVTITIRAEYADVARLVGEGMMVGFYNVLQAAGEAESLLLECIPETAFIVADDMVPSKSMTRSKSSSIIADRSPTTISSLEAEQRDLTLVATILAVSDNRPTATPAHPTQTSDRVALRVADGSGTIDVTVWDALARAARSLRPGMLVLLSNMHTSAPKMGRPFLANASPTFGAGVVWIGGLPAVVASRWFPRTPWFPGTAPAAAIDGTWIVSGVTVVGVAPAAATSDADEGRGLVYAHRQCGRPMRHAGNNSLTCQPCKVTTSATDAALHASYLFHVEWTVRDGRGQLLKCQAMDLASQAMVGTSGGALAGMTQHDRWERIQSGAVGRVVDVVLVRVTPRSGGAGGDPAAVVWRIDAADRCGQGPSSILHI